MAGNHDSPIRVVGRCLLPYRDPLRRRRIRRLSRTVVGKSTWPGEEATGLDVAQLALLRLLWLQREAHLAARHNHSESVALVTRNAIETCIVGLYCLHAPDAVMRMRDDNAQNLRAMLKYLPSELFNLRLTTRLVDTVGQPKRAPTTKAMAETVDKATGGNVLTMLYQAYYAPLSTLYAHGTGLSLLRHVDNHANLQEQPASPWFRRSALHITDSCVALLASVVAKRHATPSAELDAYYEAHRRRTITPIFYMGGGNIPRSIAWEEVPKAAIALRKLRRYYKSGQAAQDPWEARESRTRALATEALRLLRVQSSDPEIYELLVDGLAENLVGTQPPPVSDSTPPKDARNNKDLSAGLNPDRTS